MPTLPSRSPLALCLIACCISAACGEDPGSRAVDAQVGPSGSSSLEAGVAAHDDAGGAVRRDAGGGDLDAAAPAPIDAAPSDGGDRIPVVDAAPAAPTSDAGTTDGAQVKPDAQATDAGVDTGALAPADAGGPADAASEPVPDAGGPMCIERGESCSAGTCCEDSACVMDDASGDLRCLAPCELPGRCDACGPYCGAEEGPSSLHCSQPILLGKDGVYLGRAASDKNAPEGVCNTNSLYGNSYGTYSIHNPNGTYGNTFSQQSPYNPNNFDGPAIACPDEQVVIAYVNKAGNGLNDIDPDELCDWLASKLF